MNRRMRSAQALSLVRKLARAQRLTVVEMKGRGEGSHQMYRLVDGERREVNRFALTDHPADLSWTVLRRLEERLTPQFGEKWTERR